VGKSGMFRTQAGKHNISVMATFYGMPCAYHAVNSNNSNISI
jgi:hypothetical protein